MSRFKLLLFAMLVVAVAAFSSGISVSFAEQSPTAAKPTAEQEAAAAKKKAEAAVRARAKRDEAIQRKKATREYIKKVGEGQQSGAGATAPDNAGKEGAK
jgi:hypothetical protein